MYVANLDAGMDDWGTHVGILYQYCCPLERYGIRRS
jgi:hypothetical protein